MNADTGWRVVANSIANTTLPRRSVWREALDFALGVILTVALCALFVGAWVATP